jgi:MFS family permease
MPQFDKRIVTVLGALMTQFMTIGLLFSYSLFFKSFEVEYGWSRTMFSASMTFAFLVSGVLVFFGGKLSDRFGPRKVLAITGVLGSAGYGLLAWIDQPWQLFAIFGLLIGAGIATHDVVTLSTIAKLYDKRRGIMTAVVKVGTASGQIAMPPIAAFLISLYDWRLALMILGASGAVVLLMAAFLMKPPQARDLTTGQIPVGSSGAGGIDFSEARRNSTFWMICAIQFCFFTTLTTIPFHIVIHGMDLGMTAAKAATMLSLLGGASVAGRLAVGALVDRFGGKRTLIFLFVPLIGSLLSFNIISAQSIMFVAIAVYGFAHGGFFTVTSPNVARYFGLKAHGTIFGFVLFCGTMGGAIGPLLAGRIFDTMGSYVPAFTALAVLAGVGLILSIRLPASGLDH